MIRQLEGLELVAVMKRIADVMRILIHWMAHGPTQEWQCTCDMNTALEILCGYAVEDMREADRLLTLLKFVRRYETNEAAEEGHSTLIDTCRAAGLPLPAPGAVSRF